MTAKHRRLSIVALSVGISMVAATYAQAGPPLICHPFQTGPADLLPWGDGTGWNSPARGYDLRRLTSDTLRLLSGDAPTLSRMENIRRAAVYASRDRRVAAELLAAVLGKALLRAAEGTAGLFVWFDAGYLIETYRHASDVYRWDMLSTGKRISWTMQTEPGDVDGYALILKAMHVGGARPEMEFAASLMTQGTVSEGHRRRALAGTTAGSLLAKNLQHEPVR